MMRFMKRGLSPASGSSSPNSSTRKVASFSLFSSSKKPTGGGLETSTPSTGSDESSVNNDLGEAPAWSARHFLEDGPLQDDDWWVAGTPLTAVEQGMLTQQQFERYFGPNSGNAAPTKTFVNKGLETWEKTREAWTASSGSSESSPSQRPETKRRPMARFRKRELVRNLQVERQFTLPQRVPLKDLVSLYTTEVWTENHNSSGDF